MRGARAALAALALVVPSALHLYTQDRLAAAARALGQSLGAEVHLGAAEVGLTGTLIFQDVRVGALVTARSVEAAVGLESLLAGRLAADELVVVGPRVHVDAEALRLLARLPAHGGAGTGAGGPRRLRRVIIRDGEVDVDLGDLGRATAHDVEIEPQEGGVRVVLGPSAATLRWHGLEATAAFARAGLDVELPSGRLGRAALDGGHMTIATAGQPPLELSDVVIVRRQTVRLDGQIDGGGRLSATLGPGATATLEADRLPLAPLAPLLPAFLDPTGTLGGTARVVLDGPTVTATAQVTAKGLALRHPVLALVPVRLDGRLDARLSWDRGAGRGAGTVRLATSGLAFESDVALTLGPEGGLASATLAARLPTVACADALAALPAPLRGPLDGLDLAGTLAGRAGLAFDAARPDDTRLELDLDVGCSALRDESAAQVELLAGPYPHRLPDGNTRVLGASDPAFVPLAALPAWVPAAFVAAEDARFFEHHGFDPEQLRRSLAVDMSSGKIERGGSTISQQLVKNLYLGRERTLARKLTEAVLTWRLEARVPKPRILEAYLNVIELGQGVYGIGPAAERWFSKPAARLSPAEAAYLAAATAAPTTAELRLRATGHPDAELLRRARVVLRALRPRLGAGELAHALNDLDDLRPATI